MQLRLCFYKFGLDHPSINAWFGGMYTGYFNALEKLGCTVIYSSKVPCPKADILVVPLGDGQDQSSAQAMQEFNGPVIIVPGPAAGWYRRDFLLRWRKKTLFAYGEDITDYSRQMYRQLGIAYYHLTYASDPSVMRPLNVPKMYDIIFVGNATSGEGRYKYIDMLFNKLRSYKILLVGPRWDKYGFPDQSIAWGELLNLLYNLSAICINLHTDRQKAFPEKRLDANNRLFDLAMAGCFQISDAPQIVHAYFDKSEVIAVDSPDEWVDKIFYYLNHPSETEPFRYAARERALKDHTWENRAETLLKAIDQHLPTWNKEDCNESCWEKLSQRRDTHLPPYGLDEAMNKVRRRTHRMLHFFSS